MHGACVGPRRRASQQNIRLSRASATPRRASVRACWHASSAFTASRARSAAGRCLRAELPARSRKEPMAPHAAQQPNVDDLLKAHVRCGCVECLPRITAPRAGTASRAALLCSRNTTRVRQAKEVSELRAALGTAAPGYTDDIWALRFVLSFPDVPKRGARGGGLRTLRCTSCLQCHERATPLRLRHVHAWPTLRSAALARGHAHAWLTRAPSEARRGLRTLRCASCVERHERSVLLRLR